MDMNFCRRCGKPLANINKHVFKCADGHVIFANASPAAGVLVLNKTGDQILLGTRAQEPNKGMLDNFGGFLNTGEDLESAALREVHEETGLESGDLEPLQYLCNAYHTYDYKNEILPVVGVLFWTRLQTNTVLRPGDDIASIAWHPLHEVKLDEIHSPDTQIGIEKLREIFPRD